MQHFTGPAGLAGSVRTARGSLAEFPGVLVSIASETGKQRLAMMGEPVPGIAEVQPYRELAQAIDPVRFRRSNVLVASAPQPFDILLLESELTGASPGTAVPSLAGGAMTPHGRQALVPRPNHMTVKQLTQHRDR